MSGRAPLVSVVVPVFNAGPYLEPCLRSALDQTLTSVEVIVVDDGSTDGSLARAEDFAAADPRVTVVPTGGGGAGAARNRGLAVARGRWVQFLDADDVMTSDKVGGQAEALADLPADTVGVSAYVEFRDGEDPGEAAVVDGWPLVNTDDPRRWLVDLLGPEGVAAMVPVGCWLTPRALTERAGPWHEGLASDQDGEFFARVLLVAGRIRRCGEGCYGYRRDVAGSITAGKTEHHLAGRLEALDLKGSALLGAVGDDAPERNRARRALANRYLDLAYAAYPGSPEISRRALRRVRRMGGTSYRPSLGGSAVTFVGRVCGWRAARRLSAARVGLATRKRRG